MNSMQKLIPISSREIWDQVNQVVKAKRYSHHDGGIRCYSSQLQALAELALGTTQFLSHKKNASVFYGSNPSFEMLTPAFLREGVKVQSLVDQALPQSLPEAKTWVEGLPKDTAYVLFSEDHVVTAEVFPWEFLDEALNEKRIPSLRMSHHRHRFENPASSVRPFSVRICLLNLDHVVALVGSRFKTPPGMVSGLNWELDFAQEIDDLFLHTELIESAPLVQAFEAQLHEFVFLSTASRVYDRAVLCFPDINSARLIDQLCSRASLTSGTSLCSWSSFRLMSGWWKPSPTPEQLRGLLLIPALALKDERLAIDLRKICAQIRQEQTWLIKA
jgi:hypothetical protein